LGDGAGQALRQGVRLEVHIVAELDQHEAIASGQVSWFEYLGSTEVMLKCPLASFIQQRQLPLLVSHLFHRYLGTPEDPRMLAEHRLVVEPLLFGAADAAAAALSAHLDAALLRGLGRLKVLAVIPAPDVIPSYLVPANW
jgi:hypothetical protein